jgi:hypothetical protein
MAWELGAAVALERVVVVGRALGAAVEDLPLNLRGRYAPDLGSVDDTLNLFYALRRELNEDFSESTLRAEYERYSDRGLPSPFFARVLDDGGRVKLSTFPGQSLGSEGVLRGMVENVSAVGLRQVRITPNRSQCPDDVELAESVVRGLDLKADPQDVGSASRRLQAEERVVFTLRAEMQGKECELRFEWVADGFGREQQDISVKLPVPDDNSETPTDVHAPATEDG